jgi:hypothetical protein
VQLLVLFIVICFDVRSCEHKILVTSFGTKKRPFFWDETPRLWVIPDVSGRQSVLVSRVDIALFSDISILEGNTTVSFRNVGNLLRSDAASHLSRKDYSYAVAKV